MVGSIWSVALSPDARRLMTASEDFTARVWDVLSGNCAHVLEGHTGWVVHIAATNDGQHCATASHDGTARSAFIQQLHTSPLVCLHFASSPVIQPQKLPVCLTCCLRAMCHFALCICQKCSEHQKQCMPGTVCTSELCRCSGCSKQAADTNQVRRCQSCSDASTTCALLIILLCVCRIWNLQSGACKHVLQGHTGRVNSIKVNDLNNTAVTVSDDFTARVWDWTTGQCRHVLAGHGGWVSDMALLGSASKAITVSGDDLAVVWDLDEGKCCNVLEGHSAEVNSVVLTRRGRYMALLSCVGASECSVQG